MSKMDKILLLITENSSTVKFSISTVVATIGGFAASFLGGIDKLLISLVTMIVIDYVSGVVKAIYLKKLSSAVGFKGIMKKILILLMVGLSVTLQNVMPQGIPLREITVLFFIANEGFSIIENASEVIPLPKKLSSVLAQIKKTSEDLSELDETTEKNDSESSSQDSED